jgi:hypothetical protein
MAAVKVVPMPLLSGSSRAIRRIAALARPTAARTSATATGSGRRATSSTASWAATSPALAPPMPSATAITGGRLSERSSLCRRTRPVSDRSASSTRASSPPAVPSDAIADPYSS